VYLEYIKGTNGTELEGAKRKVVSERLRRQRSFKVSNKF
jgi:hypothetical protein